MEKKAVNTRMDGKTFIISLSGRLTYDYIGDFKDSILNDMKEAEGYILDLSDVEQVDSTGMGLIVNTGKKFIKNKEKLVLVITDKMTVELFTIAKLDKIFDIEGSIEDAKATLVHDDSEYWNRVSSY